MALEPVVETLGLWRDNAWRPNTPGIYAIIAGVSRYPHLKGGSDEATETYGMEQLEVSARTAATVFNWLRSEYRHIDLPVVWCYLLLSPSDQEETYLRNEGITHYAEPTNSQLRAAIQLRNAMLPVPYKYAKRSRTLFFFSGHGLQAGWDPLLLTSDYLFPPDGQPQLQNCVSTREMIQWMETHPVGEHLAIFDACRNQFSPLTSKGATALTLFDTNRPGRPPKAVACLSATAPHAVAFQTSSDKLSIFGRALVEGLRGAGGGTTTSQAGMLEIEFQNLVRFVKPRVMELLRAHNQQLEQTPRPSLEPCDATFVVTQVPIPSESPPPATESTWPVTAPGYAIRPMGTALDRLSEEQWTAEAEKDLDARFGITTDASISLSELQDYPTAHGFFGHEYASGLWGRFEIRSLADNSLVADPLEVQHVARDEKSFIVRVDMELHASNSGYLAVFDSRTRGRQALMLPTDTSGSVPVRLTLTLDGSGLDRIEAQLGPSQLPHYDYIWDLSRIAKFASFKDAAKSADPVKLREAVKDKLRFSTAAVAGAIILACGGMIRVVPKDWTHNLMEWFPWVPDCAVLWAETLRTEMLSRNRQPFNVTDSLGEMAEAVGSLESRGIPFFADSVELLDRQLRYLYQKRGDLSNEQNRSLDSVRSMLDRMSQILSPSGHFLLLFGLPRPASLNDAEGPLRTAEMLKLLRPGKALQ